MLLLTRFAARFYTHNSSTQTTHSLAIIGGGAGLGYLLNALKATYGSLDQSLKVTVFEPQSLGTGHAFHPQTPMEFTTNTAGHEIHGLERWWLKSPIELKRTWDINEKMPRALVGSFLQENLKKVLDDPGPLHVTHIPKKVINLYASQKSNTGRILHLTTQDGEHYSADAYVIATGQIGTHKQLPGMPPARVVNSIYPFINDVSPLTVALNPLLSLSKKIKIMIVGSGPSGIETSQYLLRNYQTRLRITLVGDLNDIPADIVFDENVTVISRKEFESIPDDKKYEAIDLVVNAMGMNPDPRGGLLESIIPQSNIKLLRGTVRMKTKEFKPVVSESAAGTLCVNNAYLYGAAAEGGQVRLSYLSSMAHVLAEQIAKGTSVMQTAKPEYLTPFSMISMDGMAGYAENYFLEPLSGDPNEQQYKMLKGFTANRLLQSLLLPQQVPPAICGQNQQTRQLYLLHKRIDKNFLAKTVEELLGLTDPKLTDNLRQLFALNEQGNTIIPLRDNRHIRVTQRIRTKLALTLLNNVKTLDENQIYMVLFPYEGVKDKLPSSLIDKDSSLLHVAIPSLHGTIGNNLLHYIKKATSLSEIAFERAFRNTEDPSPLALPLSLIKKFNYTQSKRRVLVRMSAHHDMSSYNFINDSADIFSFFIHEINHSYQDEAKHIAENFYDQVDISLRILTILRLREWIFSIDRDSAPFYLEQYYQSCKKCGIHMDESFKKYFQDHTLWEIDNSENPYLNRQIQENAFNIFLQLEQLQNHDHYHIRNLRAEISSLPEDKQHKPLYDLSDIMYAYIKTNQHMADAKDKAGLNHVPEKQASFALKYS